MALPSHRHQHRHVHQPQIGSHIPNIQGLTPRDAREIQTLTFFDSHLILEAHKIRIHRKSRGNGNLTTNFEEYHCLPLPTLGNDVRNQLYRLKT